jgi:hypothetical protein
MAQDPDIRLLTSPRIFLVGMAAFLALVGFVVLILYQQIALAFSANPGLNGLILGILTIGALFTFRQVIRLFREIRWVNSLTGAQTGSIPTPRLLAPMAAMLNAGAGARGLSTITTRAILDSIATRLDEGRELSRYLVGLLVFLGLLGTFWGLLETVHSIAGVIDSMKTGVDTATMFDALKTGLSAPIAGMSVSFTSSLFGLASSLVLGFLDLQAGQAQNRDAGRADHPAGRATGDREPARRQGDRDARRRHPGVGRPHAHRTAANSRLGRRPGGAAGGHRQAPPPPAGRTRDALVPPPRGRGEGEEEAALSERGYRGGL